MAGLVNFRENSFLKFVSACYMNTGGRVPAKDSDGIEPSERLLAR